MKNIPCIILLLLCPIWLFILVIITIPFIDEKQFNNLLKLKPMEYSIIKKTEQLPYCVIDTDENILFKAESEEDAVEWINERSTLELNSTGLAEKERI